MLTCQCCACCSISWGRSGCREALRVSEALPGGRVCFWRCRDLLIYSCARRLCRLLSVMVCPNSMSTLVEQLLSLLCFALRLEHFHSPNTASIPAASR